MISWIEEACAARASLKSACEVAGLSVPTLQRWRGQDDIQADARAAAAQGRAPANRISEAERSTILEVCNGPEFADREPTRP